MRFLSRALSAAALAAACSASFGAGTVTVTYVEPQTFTDFGYTSFMRGENMSDLTQLFVKVGQRRLADGQSLSVEILDVDLAGTTRPGGREMLRFVRANDWARIHLRYTITDGSHPPRTGDQWLTSFGESSISIMSLSSDTLATERRMLDRWLGKTLEDAVARN